MLLSLEPQANQGAYNGIRDLCPSMDIGGLTGPDAEPGWQWLWCLPLVSLGPQGYSGSVLFQLLS